MRQWWQDVLINTIGGTLGTVIAAGMIALAGKAAGLFDAAREFAPGEFAAFLSFGTAMIGAVAAAVQLVVMIVQESE